MLIIYNYWKILLICILHLYFIKNVFTISVNLYYWRLCIKLCSYVHTIIIIIMRDGPIGHYQYCVFYRLHFEIRSRSRSLSCRHIRHIRHRSVVTGAVHRAITVSSPRRRHLPTWRTLRLSDCRNEESLVSVREPCPKHIQVVKVCQLFTIVTVLNFMFFKLDGYVTCWMRARALS